MRREQTDGAIAYRRSVFRYWFHVLRFGGPKLQRRTRYARCSCPTHARHDVLNELAGNEALASIVKGPSTLLLASRRKTPFDVSHNFADDARHPATRREEIGVTGLPR
jgi:hypothetical protein